MTVTIFPPRPFFSMRSFATMREGTGAFAVRRLLHWQFDSGQPQSGQMRPLSVEYTVREVMALLSEQR
jgi:hypothetical protein